MDLEIEKLAHAQEGVVHDELKQTRGQVEQASQLIERAVGQLQVSFRAIESAAREQQAQIDALLNSVATDGDPKNRSRSSLQGFVQEAGETLQQLCEIIERSGARSAEVAVEMTQISSNIAGVTNLMKRIDLVAEQTSCLAFNLALEATRCGEQGKGLAAVATEVRTLSRSVRTLADDIDQNIRVTDEGVGRVQGIVSEMASSGLEAARESKQRVTGMLGRVGTFELAMSKTTTALTASTREVTARVADAVRCLQFEDIAGQVLHAAGARCQGLDQTFTVLRNTLAPEGTLFAEADRRVAAGATLLTELRQTSKDSQTHKVEQQSMDEGEVTLF